MSSNLAYRFREENVRRFESQIATILDSYPSVVTFHPANVETFSCRLRDAIKSFRMHRWPTEAFCLRELADHEIVVAIRGAVVLAGNRAAVAAHTGESPREVENDPLMHPMPGVIVEPSEQVLHALLQLHHARVLTAPSFIQAAVFDPNVWQEQYDVAIEPLSNNQYKIL